jgi:penicillin amidase
MWPTTRLLGQPENVWWDDARTTDVVETRDEILAQTLGEAYQAAVAQLGVDRNLWRWGDLHTATFRSLPLGDSDIPILERIMNRGPYAVGGGTNVVNATSWSEAPGDYFAVDVLPSMRMVIDMAQLGGSTAANSTGQSGHVTSEHYDDMIEVWQTGRYHPMLWTRTQVERAAVTQLLLNPPFSEGTECCQR